ncbi:hypothetical protein [Micromonospora sp. NPDC126480]|uniref:hypothetical protein n=1 Tax=Micromonospora sp. NPDC126480 TaxID=3155312 RepID=UPI00331ACFFA
MTLTAVAAGLLLGQRRRRAAAGGASGTAEDPLIEWVASLRHHAPPPAGCGRTGRDTTPPAGPPTGVMTTARAIGAVHISSDRSDPAAERPPAEVAERPSARVSERPSAGKAELSPDRSGRAVAHRRPQERRPTGDRSALDPIRSTGQGNPTGPPTRRDPRRPGGAPPPAAGGSRVPASAGALVTRTEPAPARRWDAAPLAAFADALVTAPRRALLVAGVVTAAVGAVLGGPVAATAGGAYAALGVRALLRRRAARDAARVRRRRLDQLCDLAADLRAGLPVSQAVALATEGGPAGALVRAAVQLADRTGAPLAELLERMDVDARAADRGLAAAAAQAAGARATAWLLAALPLGGIGLGYGIGVDPVAVLLHTPVGGGCAVLAVALQVAGLLWAERLTSFPRRDVG